MNKIKDFIYDKNDLLIALLIVAAAAFVIISKVDVIMAYPTSLAAEAESGNVEVVATTPGAQAKPPRIDTADGSGSQETPGDNEDEQDPQGEDATPPTDDVPPISPPEVQISIYINAGATGSEIAQVLINSGLIDTKQTFYDAVASAGVETRLQAGSFKIPSGATPAEIVRIITK